MQTENTLYDLADYGLLHVSGLDAKKLLQGQLTCDVEKIDAHTNCLGAHCNPQGRIISLFYLFSLEQAYYLLMPRSMIALSLAALQKYAVFYKVALSDVSDDFVIIGYRGKDSDTAIPNFPIKISLSPLRRILIGKRTQKQNTWETLAPASPLANANTWKCLDIQEGIPTIYPETSGKFLPHEINLHNLNGISFDKGCYTGQEIIARMHYRGKLKTQLLKTTITEATPPERGAELTFLQDGLTPMSGTLVDICHEEYNNYYALIVARK